MSFTMKKTRHNLSYLPVIISLTSRRRNEIFRFWSGWPNQYEKRVWSYGIAIYRFFYRDENSADEEMPQVILEKDSDNMKNGLPSIINDRYEFR